MAKRKLLKVQDRQALFDIPTDEDSLMRHYSLSPADRLEIEIRRREQNRIGFAVQLCLMRYPGRVLMANEIPPKAMRGGSVCLNSFGRLVKWISASIMPPPSSVPAR